jgi:NADH-quinone oxidoreductase subunit C
VSETGAPNKGPADERPANSGPINTAPASGEPTESEPTESEPPETEVAEGGPAANGGPELLYGCPVTERFGQRTAHTDRSRYLALMEALYKDGFEVCLGVAGVDYLTHPGRDLPAGIGPERFEVVVELLSLSRKERLRVRCQVSGDEPVLPSLFDLWPGSEAHERETFDMFGIRFDDHPDLTRILMPEDWEGYPLRKDYPAGNVPVQFKEAPS